MPTYEATGSPTAAPTDLTPYDFTANSDVIAEDAVEVIEAANYAACVTCRIHYCGGFGASVDFLDDAFDQPSGDSVLFDAALNTWERRYGPNYIIVGKNVTSLRFLARCLVASTETVQVRLLVDGTVRATLSFDDGDNGSPVSALVSVATIGGPSGYSVEVEIRRTSGGATNQLIMWTLDGEARAANTLALPSG